MPLPFNYICISHLDINGLVLQLSIPFYMPQSRKSIQKEVIVVM